MKNLLSLFALMVGLTVSSVVHADLAIGQPAPGTVSFATWDGTQKSLNSYAGKIVVLEWFNPECPFVKKHYRVGNMQTLQKEYTAKGIVWLTVNSSAPGKQGALTAEQAKAIMAENQGVPTSVVLDSAGELGKAFGAKTTPHMFILDRSGKLVYSGAIDDNDSARSETIASAHNYVKAALDEMLLNKPVTTAQTASYGCSVKYLG